MKERAVETLRGRLADARGGQVVFASHCLLNENVRYLGGACMRGAVDELVDDWQSKGYGVCQMPCPEQRVWGGVLKPVIAMAFGIPRPLGFLRRPLMRVLVRYTKLRYRLLARRVAKDIRDYRRSGYAVTGIVGVAGSPSCGITKTLDVQRWLDVVGGYRPDQVTRDQVNSDAVIANVIPGEGWFMDALFRRLRGLGLSPPRSEHDLVAELQAERHARS